jgi:hypothetical protein
LPQLQVLLRRQLEVPAVRLQQLSHRPGVAELLVVESLAETFQEQAGLVLRITP